MNGLFSIAFDASSLQAIERLLTFDASLNAELPSSLEASAQAVVDAAVANTWQVFKNPTGEFASTIRYILDSPTQVEVGTDKPQAHRLEAGFHGTDSLGRHYDEAAEPYLAPALESSLGTIQANTQMAVAAAIARMGIPL
jgi:hypothetical protein